MTLLAAPAASRDLDWLDRAICIYLLLPAFLFCLWYTTPFAVLLLILIGYGAYRALSSGGKGKPIGIPWPWLVAICALSLAWTAVSGVGHFFHSNTDWLIRDAVLHDLTSTGWPPSYTDDDGASLILRAPVGYYLPSAAIGQLWGLEAANFSLYLWTALGFALFLATACRLFKTHTQRVACVLLMLLFGGMDMIGYTARAGHPPGLGENVEWWFQIIQYPSNSYLIAWVPNHTLPAWLGIIMILRFWGLPGLSRITPLLSVAIPLWSPLAAIGLFPFFLFALAWRKDFRILFSPHTCLPFLLPALAIASYLGMDAGTIPHLWLIQLFPSTGEFLHFYVLFCLLEFGLLALILSRLTTFTTATRIAVVVLCLLPIYAYGPYNDLAMRSSIPALSILALTCIEPLTEQKRSIWQTLLLCVLAIGMLGSVQEPIRGLIGQRWKPLNKSIPDVILIEHDWAEQRFPTHYFAHPDQHGTNRFIRMPGADNAVMHETGK
ncbi:MAG: hypothetical protein E6R00_05725 [Gammaproteobacteria bacterium]|nr:MAG: hypothetical protein E6R00_05725 [Gammaproteobacteria bacterium]